MCVTNGQKGTGGKGKTHFVFFFAHPTCKTKKRDIGRLDWEWRIKLKGDITIK